MPDLVLPTDKHDQIVTAAYRQRGFSADEADAAAGLCRLASWHGVKTHNAIKALHLDDHFGSGNPKRPGCVPGAQITKRNHRFAAAEVWDAHRKLGQAVAFEAIATAEKLADQFGVGIVSVDHAFHYLWGGGYVMQSARRGYFAYTNCTAALAEVVPFGGRFPTLGTNPHSWGIPTQDAIGFPIVIDWATSTVAMGRVQQFKREGKQLPPDAAVDQDGKPTTDPNRVAALLPFGRHKGYGLSLIDELVAALIGGSLPTLRSRPEQAFASGGDASGGNASGGGASGGEKTTPNFFFQVIHPEAMSSGAFAKGRTQAENVKAVLDDILGHGNDTCILPGQIEHEAGLASEKAGGLIFTEAEVREFKTLADAVGVDLDPAALARL